VQRAQDGKGGGDTQVGPWARLRRGTGWRGCGGAQVGGGRAGARGAAQPAQEWRPARVLYWAAEE